ncbi:hypothetical protein V8E51_010763 [Hyaloscypha variabilis]
MPPSKSRKRAAPAKKSRKRAAQDVVIATPAKCFLLRLLPTEVLLGIFSFLDPVTSACLGLTCTRLYAMHRSQHPKPIDLHLTIDIGERKPAGLRYLIDELFIGKGLLWVAEKNKFVDEDVWIATTHAEWRKRAAASPYDRDWILAQTQDLEGKWVIDLSEFLPNGGKGGQLNRFLQKEDATSFSPVNPRGEIVETKAFNLQMRNLDVFVQQLEILQLRYLEE